MKRIKGWRACAIAFAACVLALPAVAASPSRADVRQVVDSVARPLMAKHALPGLAIGVVIHGHAYAFEYGVASRATHAPVTASTLFELGSVSKTFTATLAARAQAEGKLRLSDRVGSFLPTLAGKPFGKTTLLELGTHTPGGLPLQVPDTVHDNAELLTYLAAWKPTCTPGACRTYTNIGIGTLGWIVAKHERAPFTTLMQQQVLAPLGLHETFYTVPANRMADYAQGYTNAGKPIRVAPGVLDMEAYGVKSSVHDMLRWLEANLGVLHAPAPLQRAFAITQTGYFKAGPLTQDLIWEQYPYPVTLPTLLTGNGKRMIFNAVPATRIAPPAAPAPNAWINKTGSTNGFATYIAFIPGEQSGVVLLANKGYPIADRVTAAYTILTRLLAQ